MKKLELTDEQLSIIEKCLRKEHGKLWDMMIDQHDLIPFETKSELLGKFAELFGKIDELKLEAPDGSN